MSFSHSVKCPSRPRAVAMTPPELAPNKKRGVFGAMDLRGGKEGGRIVPRRLISTEWHQQGRRTATAIAIATIQASSFTSSRRNAIPPTFGRASQEHLTSPCRTSTACFSRRGCLSRHQRTSTCSPHDNIKCTPTEGTPSKRANEHLNTQSELHHGQRANFNGQRSRQWA